MEQRRWWLTPKQQEKRNDRAYKHAQTAIRIGTYQEPIQDQLPLDLNHRTNGDLPVPPTAQRFQDHQGHIPLPPQIPKDPNTYYPKPPRPHPSPTMATLYNRERTAFLKHKQATRPPQQLEILSAEEEDYMAETSKHQQEV